MKLRIDEETPDHQPRTDHDTWRGYFFNPTDRGGVYIRIALAAILLQVVAIAATTVELALRPNAGTTVGILAILSLLFVAAGALFGYTLWSFRKQRRLRREQFIKEPTPLVLRPIRAVQLVFADGEELDEYEARVQRTVLGLAATIIVGNLPLRLVLVPLLEPLVPI